MIEENKNSKTNPFIPSAKDKHHYDSSSPTSIELLTKQTELLTDAYNSLKEEFESVYAEHEKTHLRLENKITEQHTLTEYYNNLLSNISQPLLFVDLNGDITTFNPAAETLFALSTQTVLKENYWRFFQDRQFGFSVREALAQKSCPGTLFVQVTLNDVVYDLEVNSSFVFDTSSKEQSNELVRKMEGIVILLNDITEIKRLQKINQQNESLKTLGEMAALVAHEIRNPLGGIRGFASLLEKDLLEKPQMLKMVRFIIEGCDDLNEVVNNILNYSRPVQPDRKSQNINSIIEEVITSLRMDEAFSKEIQFSLTATDETISANVDEKLLKAALLNIGRNAIEAMEGKGCLKFLVEGKTQECAISISDKGSGISKENLKKIFTPFFTTKPKGNGFGLPEVHKIVESHGGSIDVASEEGQGTTFTIHIPK